MGKELPSFVPPENRYEGSAEVEGYEVLEVLLVDGQTLYVKGVLREDTLEPVGEPGPVVFNGSAEEYIAHLEAGRRVNTVWVFLFVTLLLCGLGAARSKHHQGKGKAKAKLGL